jgi:protoporphyrinogen oxidase
MASSSPEHIGIIGAGPSGLAVSLFLNQPCDIFERENHVGGHAASFLQAGFTFDYGPHILFSRDIEILDFIVASLGENVSQCKRNNKIYFKGRLVKYPFENDLHALPLEDNYACIQGFIFNPYKEKYATPGNMKEWLLKQFGEGICSRYLFPYNEKVWNIPVEQLSMTWADRIPNPPAEDILKSSLGYSTEGYLHQLYYFYPQAGGYQSISEAWKHAATIQFKAAINKIRWTAAGKIQLSDEQGQTREYRQIISTMPVHELVHYLDREVPQDIFDAISRLIVNPMYVVSFGVRGIDTNQYTAIYFPDADFLVNRISYPCTFSAKNGPAGHWSLQAEITCAKTADAWFKSDEEILLHTRQGLQTRGLLPADEDIILQRVDRKEQSYVVYDVGYEACAEQVRHWFASIGIQLLGRFSYFEYVNVDMAVSRALEIAVKLNGDKGDVSQLKPVYLQRALAKLRAAVEVA